MKRIALGIALWLSGALQAAPLFHADFTENAPAFDVQVSSTDVVAKTSTGAVGTIDEAKSVTPSRGLRLQIERSAATGNWSAFAQSAAIPIQNQERDLSKLTVGLMLSSSTVRPITVQLESLDRSGNRTGGLEKTLYPAAPEFYQRYAFELDSATPVGDGTFNPLAPAVRMSIGVRSVEGASPTGPIHVDIDNLSFASPSFYVSPKGSDQNDGRSADKPFATPQHAMELARAGDIVLLGGGTYPPGGISFLRPGTPAAWIVVKNVPGETPVLRSNGWTVVQIAQGSKGAISTLPALAYLEVRGLTVKGTSSRDATGHPTSPYPKLIGKVVPETNGNGISVEGRYAANPPHHVRFADNIVTLNAGVGISVIASDWAYLENNVSSDNAWWTCYACSGISFLVGTNFDGTTGGYRYLVRHNKTFGNECFAEWTASDGAPHHLSDGNGIIIDTLQGSAGSQYAKTPPFTGRTLVQGNLSFNNGGSGMHVLKSDHVDMVNNTVDFNSASPTLHYPQIFGSYAHDVLFLNNIVVAPDYETVNNASAYGLKMSSNLVWRNNLYFGGTAKPVMGDNDRVADPLFIKPTRDSNAANFALRAGSPAIGCGEDNPLVPLTDITGRPRTLGKAPTIGAYQGSDQ